MEVQWEILGSDTWALGALGPWKFTLYIKHSSWNKAITCQECRSQGASYLRPEGRKGQERKARMLLLKVNGISHTQEAQADSSHFH